MTQQRTQGGGRSHHGREREKDREFDQRILDLARVTRVTAGGKRMRFRAAVILGDHKGKVGFGVAKAGDVTAAVAKATTQARKKMTNIVMQNNTIPHGVRSKYGAAIVILKPAPLGTGIKAGGAMRVIFELAGIPNVVGKILGSKNKINNTRATILALQELRTLKPRREKINQETTPEGASKK